MALRRTEDMSVSEIMTRWPQTISVFLDFELHCIGCPIAPFHTLADAAEEHGVTAARFDAAIADVIAGSGENTARAGPSRRRRQ